MIDFRAHMGLPTAQTRADLAARNSASVATMVRQANAGIPDPFEPYEMHRLESDGMNGGMGAVSWRTPARRLNDAQLHRRVDRLQQFNGPTGWTGSQGQLSRYARAQRVAIIRAWHVPPTMDPWTAPAQTEPAPSSFDPGMGDLGAAKRKVQQNVKKLSSTQLLNRAAHLNALIAPGVATTKQIARAAKINTELTRRDNKTAARTAASAAITTSRQTANATAANAGLKLPFPRAGLPLGYKAPAYIAPITTATTTAVDQAAATTDAAVPVYSSGGGGSGGGTSPYDDLGGSDPYTQNYRIDPITGEKVPVSPGAASATSSTVLVVAAVGLAAWFLLNKRRK